MVPLKHTCFSHMIIHHNVHTEHTNIHCGPRNFTVFISITLSRQTMFYKLLQIL